MHLDVAPETERLVREEIRSGHVRSVDEIIKAGVPGEWRLFTSQLPAEKLLRQRAAFR